MIDWKLEEKRFIDEKVSNYRKSLSTLSLILMSDKQLNKNIENVKIEAMLQFRRKKLNDLVEIVKEERKRIDKTIEQINERFLEYLESQKALISKEIKPIQIKLTNYDDIENAKFYEIVDIYLEPFKIGFIQERLDKGE